LSVTFSSAIDLVIGGPPGVDFSAVNARREGVEGEQGQYMVRFGLLIRSLEQLQKNRLNRPLFFLAENVPLNGDDLWRVREAFGLDWDPITFDAQYLSPCRRKRHFFHESSLAKL
jgi:site-specific DNA-cytosine methylase